MRNNLKEKILSLFDTTSPENLLPTDPQFEAVALEVFAYQYKYNAFYQRYCKLIGKDFSKISHLRDVPFLPIQFFKSQKLQTGTWAAEAVFSSSGTTGSTTSQHLVRELDFYNSIARKGFSYFYGDIADYGILALLPSYLERSGSSLIAMTADFINISQQPESGFFLNEYQKLADILRGGSEKGQKTLLIGVSFGLLDFGLEHSIDFPELIVMETGGMKGRRREMIRAELHEEISKIFNVKNVHSEYGMTEMMSQGYAQREGFFLPIPSLRCIVRDVNDPLSTYYEGLPEKGKLGVLNLIDLGNLDTCSFIATDDLARTYPNGTFEVLGRLDNSDIRGCNLLVA